MSDIMSSDPVDPSVMATLLKQTGETDPGFQSLRLRQAVIQSVETNSVTLRLAGSSTDVAGVACLFAFPAVSQTVWCFQLGPVLIVIGPKAGATTGMVPPGTMVDYGGTSAPTGWLLCDGTAVSRTTYAGLFSAIGTNFGSGNGSTTFNVPDFRGRTSVGTGAGSGLTSRTIGTTGGAETHALTTGELASHTHIQSNHIHSIPSRYTDSSGHTHTTGAAGKVAESPSNSGSFGDSTGATATDGGGNSTGSAGSGTAHNNMQPFRVATKIIKT